MVTSYRGVGDVIVEGSDVIVESGDVIVEVFVTS